MAFSAETYALLKAQGGGGGGGSSDTFIIHASVVSGALTLDKTWNEINTALRAGKACFIFYIRDDGAGTMPVTHVAEYYVDGFDFEGGVLPFTAESADGYPSLAL